MLNDILIKLAEFVKAKNPKFLITYQIIDGYLIDIINIKIIKINSYDWTEYNYDYEIKKVILNIKFEQLFNCSKSKCIDELFKDQKNDNWINNFVKNYYSDMCFDCYEGNIYSNLIVQHKHLAKRDNVLVQV